MKIPRRSTNSDIIVRGNQDQKRLMSPWDEWKSAALVQMHAVVSTSWKSFKHLLQTERSIRKLLALKFEGLTALIIILCLSATMMKWFCLFNKCLGFFPSVSWSVQCWSSGYLLTFSFFEVASSKCCDIYTLRKTFVSSWKYDECSAIGKMQEK